MFLRGRIELQKVPILTRLRYLFGCFGKATNAMAGMMALVKDPSVSTTYLRILFRTSEWPTIAVTLGMTFLVKDPSVP